MREESLGEDPGCRQRNLPFTQEGRDVQAVLGLERRDGWKQSCCLSQMWGEKTKESLGSGGLALLEAARAQDTVQSKGW